VGDRYVQKGPGLGQLVDPAGGQRVFGIRDVSEECGLCQVRFVQTIARELHGQDGERHPDLYFVETDSELAPRGDADVSSEQRERSAG
jgi:hypothetical protein